MSEQTILKLKIKFETTYFSVKNEFPISACKNFLRLEEKRVVVVARKYLDNFSSGVFIDYSGDDLKQQLSLEIVKNKFYSVLRDRAMDGSTIENELNVHLFRLMSFVSVLI